MKEWACIQSFLRSVRAVGVEPQIVCDDEGNLEFKVKVGKYYALWIWVRLDDGFVVARSTFDTDFRCFVDRADFLHAALSQTFSEVLASVVYEKFWRLKQEEGRFWEPDIILRRKFYGMDIFGYDPTERVGLYYGGCDFRTNLMRRSVEVVDVEGLYFRFPINENLVANILHTVIPAFVRRYQETIQKSKSQSVNA